MTISQNFTLYQEVFLKQHQELHETLGLGLTLEMLTKYFLAHDKIHYARMIPVYLAEMSSLKASDPEIYEEFIQGNWVVNNNAEVPFCAVGADTALEHKNRSMNVSGGLVGITLNEAARTKFFLIAPRARKPS